MITDKLLVEAPDSFQRAIPIAAPVSGKCASLSTLSDPLFAKGAWGPGFAIQTSESKARAPFEGTILAVDPLNYAITLRSTFGLKCIVKFGEQTNGLLGEKFQCEVKQGDKINKGSLLFSVNSAWLKQQGVANICIMSVLNAQALKGLLPTQQKYVDGIQDSLFTLFL